jgi:hypothetical protein
MMKTQGWFQKETVIPALSPKLGKSMLGRKRAVNDISGFAAKLRPHELIAMLTHHYSKVRARSLPRVKTTLAVSSPHGVQAVTISFG